MNIKLNLFKKEATQTFNVFEVKKANLKTSLETIDQTNKNNDLVNAYNFLQDTKKEIKETNKTLSNETIKAMISKKLKLDTSVISKNAVTLVGAENLLKLDQTTVYSYVVQLEKIDEKNNILIGVTTQTFIDGENYEAIPEFLASKIFTDVKKSVKCNLSDLELNKRDKNGDILTLADHKDYQKFLELETFIENESKTIGKKEIADRQSKYLKENIEKSKQSFTIVSALLNN